ncbi:MAG: hypothetical protein ABR970_06930 [Roseiarcus sp.]|jgi:hypothetical protein
MTETMWTFGPPLLLAVAVLFVRRTVVARSDHAIALRKETIADQKTSLADATRIRSVSKGAKR